MAMAARMPMIATTIISSIRVKPRWLPRFRCRLYQNRSMRSSFVFEFLPDCGHALPPLEEGGALLGAGREGVRRSAGLREANGGKIKKARFERNEGGVAGKDSRRRLGVRRGGEKNEPGEDLTAVGVVVV